MKAIPGFDGYSVSDDNLIVGRWGRPLAFYVDKDGYRRVTLAISHGKDAVRIHRGIHQLVCLTFHGSPPSLNHVVRHKDGTRTNNDPSNLCWSTLKENSADRQTHGTLPIGERSGTAKLKAVYIPAIRGMLRCGKSQRKIAAMFGLSQFAIGSIHRNKTWRHVK